MPCRYDEGPAIVAASQQKHVEAAVEAANKATRAACDMRTILRRHNLEGELAAETREWIAGHDKADAKRIAEENASGERQRVKMAALAKLTTEERQALGLPLVNDLFNRQQARDAGLAKLSMDERRVLGL